MDRRNFITRGIVGAVAFLGIANEAEAKTKNPDVVKAVADLQARLIDYASQPIKYEDLTAFLARWARENQL